MVYRKIKAGRSGVKQSGHRVILDVIEALNDEELEMENRIQCALFIFYEDLSGCDNIQLAMLESFGMAVRMSRNALTANCDNSSITASLRQRSNMANSWGADYFVSIHCNAGGGTGTEVYSYIYGSDAYNLAEKIQDKIVSATGLSDRGVKVANFSVLARSNMPAVLVESAFIDSAKDAKLLGSDSGKEIIAKAICEGILSHLGNEEGLTMTQYEELKNEIKALKEENTPMIYNYIDDNMPKWARPTIQKLVDKGLLEGGENGLNLNEDLMRMFVVNDRAGLYD